ncbi:MAG: ArsR family transcriptional regulator [Faecousia sp.]
MKQLALEIKNCQDTLLALGDKNRQHLILELMQVKDCHGVRMVDLARRSNLSRPAVSHHLQILTKAGIVRGEKK